jgi:hypothetical protein
MKGLTEGRKNERKEEEMEGQHRTGSTTFKACTVLFALSLTRKTFPKLPVIFEVIWFVA